MSHASGWIRNVSQVHGYLWSTFLSPCMSRKDKIYEQVGQGMRDMWVLWSAFRATIVGTHFPRVSFVARCRGQPEEHLHAGETLLDLAGTSVRQC